MTDLEIRPIITKLIEKSDNNEYIARKNRDRMAVMYFNGCQDALRHVLQEIDSLIEKEISEMEEQENGK